MGHYDCKECDASPWEEHSPSCGRAGGMTEKRTHASDMTEDKALVERLRDEDSYYRVQEKHWCIDAEELERQRLAAADRIEALTAENERLTAEVERLNKALKECVMEAADWARQAGEAKGRLEGSEMPGIVDGWKAENQELRSEIARLREALGVAKMWSDKDWVGYEIVCKALAGATE